MGTTFAGLRPAHAGVRPRRWRSSLVLVAMMSLVLGGVAPVAAADLSSGSLRTTISVQQFGAVPDDPKDDSAAMQKAADYLCAHPGTTLLYPPGKYKLDRIVDRDTYFSALGSGDLKQVGIFYDKCHDVHIEGVGATIDVQGHFKKTATTYSGFANYWGMDRMAFNAFIFRDSDTVTVSGFEINGNVDRMTQSVPAGAQLLEVYEDGIFILTGHDYTLQNMKIHHMATDGILLGGAGQDVTIQNVVSANNIRNALAIGQMRNVRVVDNSQLLDTGVVGTQPNSYPLHSPGRGIAIDGDCRGPANADWLPRDPNTGQPIGGCTADKLLGNVLIDHVTVAGNLGGQISMAHGEAFANVTVRNSVLQNALGKAGDVVEMGIAGAVVENSTLDAQRGTAVRCLNADLGAMVKEHASPPYQTYLQEIAADPSPIAEGIYRETQGVSVTVRNNPSITAGDTLLYCVDGYPFLNIENNTLTGKQPSDLSTDSLYRRGGGVLTVGASLASRPAGATWQPQTKITGNSIFIPNTAPRLTYHELGYVGVNTMGGNTYTTDATASDPFTAAYAEVGTVDHDKFPTDKTIRPVQWNGTPYLVDDQGYLNIPQ